MRRGLALIGLLMLPGLALAHGGFGEGTPFYSGLLHVLLGVHFVLPLVAAALLVSQRGEATIPLAQAVLGVSVAVGAMLALGGLMLGPLTEANRILAVVAGVLVALSPRLPARLPVVLMALIGAFCGYEMLRAEAPGSAVVWFVAGTVGGAMVVQGAVASAVVVARAEWARVAVRVVGSWVAAIGVIYLGFSLA